MLKYNQKKKKLIDNKIKTKKLDYLKKEFWDKKQKTIPNYHFPFITISIARTFFLLYPNFVFKGCQSILLLKEVLDF